MSSKLVVMCSASRLSSITFSSVANSCVRQRILLSPTCSICARSTGGSAAPVDSAWLLGGGDCSTSRQVSCLGNYHRSYTVSRALKSAFQPIQLWVNRAVRQGQHTP